MNSKCCNAETIKTSEESLGKGRSFCRKCGNYCEVIEEKPNRLQGGQLGYFLEYMEAEKKRTNDFSNNMSLANDRLGYDCIRVMAVLIHPFCGAYTIINRTDK